MNNLDHKLKSFLRTKKDKAIYNYLIANSNLPGRRANIELGQAFSDVVKDYFETEPELMWKLCNKYIDISAEDAPVNSQKEFVPFCGTIGIGAIGSVSDKYYRRSLSTLKRMSNDARWRIREAVAMGLQKILNRKGTTTIDILERWIDKDNWLEMRAVAAGVAEPFLLVDRYIAKKSLHIHKKILKRLSDKVETKSDEFKIAVKGLSYTLSVVVAAIPDEGFRYIKSSASSNNKTIKRIIKENLKKNRLKKNFPEEVDSLLILDELK